MSGWCGTIVGIGELAKDENGAMHGDCGKGVRSAKYGATTLPNHHLHSLQSLALLLTHADVNAHGRTQPYNLPTEHKSLWV
eukprot:scaffold6767_cov108-Skeletonema_marinoi.AAC.1